jgi:hypothetical protein
MKFAKHEQVQVNEWRTMIFYNFKISFIWTIRTKKALGTYTKT